MQKACNPAQVDLQALAQGEQTVGDESPLSTWPRLREESLDQNAVVRWQVSVWQRPALGGHPALWLRLLAQTDLALTCQRCLESVRLPVVAEREFRFVADEATALAEDDSCEEDLLVFQQAFDLLSLVEDELLLTLPLVPVHMHCVAGLQPPESDGFPASKPQSPFAALAHLRQSD